MVTSMSWAFDGFPHGVLSVNIAKLKCALSLLLVVFRLMPDCVPSAVLPASVQTLKTGYFVPQQ